MIDDLGNTTTIPTIVSSAIAILSRDFLNTSLATTLLSINTTLTTAVANISINQTHDDVTAIPEILSTSLSSLLINTTGVIGSKVNVSTSFPVDEYQHLWNMPLAATLIAVIFLATNLAVGLSANCLLIIIINNSPTLKTPANSHLINICANNLVLCLCMLLSLISVLLPVDLKNKINIMTGFHVFLISNCFLQYWGTFASISYYRSKIIHFPSMSIKRRRQIITRCLTTSWVVSLLVSLMVCLSHIENDVYACLTLNPFQKTFIVCEQERSMSSQRLSIMLINVIVFCVIFVVIFISYQKVFKALNNGKQFRRNKVLPITRSFSLPSEFGDLNINNHQTAAMTAQTNDCGIERTPYTISQHTHINDSDLVVHYQRRDGINVLTIADVVALENPILASNMRKQMMQKKPLALTRSTASNASVKSKCPDFSDISAGADLQRYQNLKNTSALRNHFLKRDRVGFNSATKNSLVMLASFIVCSLPMFVCMIPNVLSHNKDRHRVLILMFTKLAFFLNAPIYPLWYLVQNRRVRKCFTRVIDSVLIKMDIRR